MKSHRRYAKLVHPGGVAARVEYSDECVVSPQRNVRVFDRLPCGVVTAKGGDACAPCPPPPPP